MTITVSLLSSSIASLTVSNGSSPQVAKKWLDSNALAVFVPTPAWQGSALSRRSRSALFHLCMFVDSWLIWQKGSMRRRPEEEYPSEVIFCSILNGHLELLSAPGLLVKEDP